MDEKTSKNDKQVLQRIDYLREVTERLEDFVSGMMSKLEPISLVRDDVKCMSGEDKEQPILYCKLADDIHDIANRIDAVSISLDHMIQDIQI